MKKKSSKMKKSTKPEKISAPSKVKKPATEMKKDISNEITALILRDHEPIKKLLLILKDSEVGIEKKRHAYTEFEKVLSIHAKAEEEKNVLMTVRKDFDNEVRIEMGKEYSFAFQDIIYSIIINCRVYIYYCAYNTVKSKYSFTPSSRLCIFCVIG